MGVTAWQEVERAEPSSRACGRCSTLTGTRQSPPCEPTGRRGSRDRDGLRGRRAGLWPDAEGGKGRISAGIRGSPCTAPRSTRSRAPRRSGRARRRSPAGRLLPDRSKDRTATASTPTSPRSCTPTSTRRPRCSWSSGGRQAGAKDRARVTPPRPPRHGYAPGGGSCSPCPDDDLIDHRVQWLRHRSPRPQALTEARVRGLMVAQDPG